MLRGLQGAGRPRSKERQHYIVRSNLDFRSLLRLLAGLRREVDTFCRLGAQAETDQSRHFVSQSRRTIGKIGTKDQIFALGVLCLLYTSDAADDLLCVDLG